MQFHTYHTVYDLAMHTREYEKRIKAEEKATGRSRVDIVYGKDEGLILKQLANVERIHGRKFERGELARRFNSIQIQKMWIKSRRPFYTVYPGIIPYLSKLNLAKVPCEAVQVPLKAICLRFPTDRNPVTITLQGGICKGKTYPLNSILIGERADESTEGKGRAIMTAVEWNPCPGNLQTTMQIISSLFLVDGKNVQQILEEQKQYYVDGDATLESYTDSLRLIATICLLSTHWEDELVLPEVLKADEEKWNKTHDSGLLEKAKNKGVYGWSVGKVFETITVSPHWRGPSPLAKYWTGTGRKILRIRYRRGTMVHRDKVDKIPTGLEDPP